MTLVHRVAVMRNGKLQRCDTPLYIYDRPANRFVAEFVGSPGMNFLAGTLDLQGKVFSAGSISFPLNDSQLRPLAGNSATDRVVLGIRPEHVRVSALQVDDWTPATVYVTELMGSETFVFLTLARDQRIIVRAPADFRADVSSTAWIEMDISKAHFFHPTSGER